MEIRKAEYDLAAKYNGEALRLERANDDRSSELYSLVTAGYVAADQNNFVMAESDFTQVIREKTSDRYLIRQAQAGLADTNVAEKKPVDAEIHFQQAMATIEEARSSVRREDLRLSFLSGVAGFYGDYIDFLVSQGRVAEGLQVAEVSRARTLADGLGFSTSSVNFPLTNLHPQQAAKKLGSAVLSYWIGLDHSYLWVITPSGVALFTLPPAAEIDPLVQSYRQALVVRGMCWRRGMLRGRNFTICWLRRLRN